MFECLPKETTNEITFHLTNLEFYLKAYSPTENDLDI